MGFLFAMALFLFCFSASLAASFLIVHLFYRFAVLPKKRYSFMLPADQFRPERSRVLDANIPESVDNSSALSGFKKL